MKTKAFHNWKHSAAHILVCAGFVLFLAFPISAAPAAKPNILWLIAEDFGPALSCYGQKNISTPNLDQLAREGVRYDRFYTTSPVLLASRPAFMTGMYQTTIGAHHQNYLDWIGSRNPAIAAE